MYRFFQFGALVTLVAATTFFADASLPAKNPDELIRNLIAAAQQGDVAQFTSGLTAASRKTLSESFANEASLREAQQAFQRALDEKFGQGGAMIAEPTDDLKTAIARLAGAEVLGKKRGPGGTVQLQVRTSIRTLNGKIAEREDTLVAQQEGGSWKLALGFAKDGKGVADIKAALQKQTKAVRDGQYSDRTSAMVALSNDLAGKGEVRK